ncbi:MAG: U32 family peptidase, partial [Bacteroidaceae bacterium]|nr:U32 family peptidase [Bacteroidaceae bacterium]
MKTIELLAPAKNLECGIEAIKHGADAVYIGAPKFGARAAAGNSIEDLSALAEYAHQFGARVYVTLNTLIKDEELAEVEQLVWQLYRIGIDALIVQDMALLTMNLPPIPLHASTQADNRTAEKVKFLHAAGFSQVVLARELSLAEIEAIHRACPVPLEVFVHGALCVSYSGQCYASQACFGRSANRGECAQFCRLPFTLEDADGRIIERERHLLSLKDMNRSAHLEEM